MAKGEKASRARDGQLVVVGASAGGIEALSKLLANMPSKFPAALVIAQHIDPRRESHLGEILGRASTLPVRTVEDHASLESGLVYVVPPGRNVSVTDHEIRLTSERPGPKPSIDMLLTTAASIFGENLFAVILTGTGSDGAAGAQTVKEQGGTVMIQNPRTATYPALPLSLAPTTVDLVANVEDMGGILLELMTRAPVATKPDEASALRTLLSQLRDRQGIDFGKYKEPTIMRRLQRRMAATGNDSLVRYLHYLETHREEYARLVSSFLIKVTEFFRDAELFEYLKDRVIPDLVEEARGRDNNLRIWSSGCATGEEAYSIAMLVAEVLGDELNHFHVRIFATDLDGDAIEFARRGIYPATAVAAVPPDYLGRYFAEEGGDYQVSKHIRVLTVFGQHDLGERAPFPHIDLLTCRNVLIYFTKELQRHVLQTVAFSLRDGGYLVMGKAESPSQLSEYFVADNARLKVYRRRGDRPLQAPARLPDSTRQTMAHVPHSRSGLADAQTARGQTADRAQSELHDRTQRLLLQMPIGIAIVDRHYDLVSINSVARQMLGILGQAVGEDLIHLKKSVSSEVLRGAIDGALQGKDVEISELKSGGAPGASPAYLRLFCRPQQPAGPAGTEQVLVVIEDITDLVVQRLQLEALTGRQAESVVRLEEQTAQLLTGNQTLVEANEELTLVNMELRSANEEFLIGNEELQAATEEVETLNEELQATNEELETLNEELQATVEELNTTNDDLQARSIELQDLAVSLGAERAASDTERERLEAILVGMADAVLVVDRSGAPLLTNAAYDRLFGGSGVPWMAESADGTPLPPESTPQAHAARGEAFTMEFSVARDGERRYYEASGRPIGGAEAEGGVVVIRDITVRSLQRLKDEFLAMAGHELRTPLTVLTGYLGMLVRQLKSEKADGAALRSYAQLALDQARRIDALVGDLVDVSRLQTGRMTLALEDVELGALIEGVASVGRLLAPDREIRTHVGRGSVTVRGDAGRLEQIVVNLVTNAIAHALDSGPIQLSLRRTKRQAVISVQDRGPGIPPEKQSHIFERFSTSAGDGGQASTGLGLGLFIARELVTAHGGTIDVASSDEGTTFSVRIPLADR